MRRDKLIDKNKEKITRGPGKAITITEPFEFAVATGTTRSDPFSSHETPNRIRFDKRCYAWVFDMEGDGHCTEMPKTHIPCMNEGDVIDIEGTDMKVQVVSVIVRHIAFFTWEWVYKIKVL